MDRMLRCVAEASDATDGYVDRLAETVSNTTKELGIDNSLANAEARDGGQEQRPGRDLADHDRRDGEGVQHLRQSGDDLARIQPGDEPGWRRLGRRAETTRRA